MNPIIMVHNKKPPGKNFQIILKIIIMFKQVKEDMNILQENKKKDK